MGRVTLYDAFARPVVLHRRAPMPPLIAPDTRGPGGRIVAPPVPAEFREALESAYATQQDRWRKIAARHPDRFIEVDGRVMPLLAGNAANTQPIFPLTPNVSFVTPSLTANTATDGTGTVSTLFTAGSNGARVDRVRMVPLGTNASCKAYIFINNGSTTATAANNALLLDVPMGTSTASNTALIGTPFEFLIALALPATYLLTCVHTVTVVSGWNFKAFGGNY